MLVQMRGLEPPRPCEHQHLKLACLPIPPHLHCTFCSSLTLVAEATNLKMVPEPGIEPGTRGFSILCSTD